MKFIAAIFGFVLLGSFPVAFCHADFVSGSGTFENGALVDDPMNNEVFSVVTITETGFIQDISITITGLEHTNTGDLIAQLRFLDQNQEGGEPAYVFFRPNVDVANTLGSRANLNGDYTFTSDQTDASFWSESALPDDETVDDSVEFFTSDSNGDFHDLSGPSFFGGLNVAGEWQLSIMDANAFGNNEGSVVGWTIDFDVVAIPEPSTTIVTVLAVSGLLLRRRTK